MRRKDQTERRWTSNILQVSDIHVKHVKKTFSQTETTGMKENYCSLSKTWGKHQQLVSLQPRGTGLEWVLQQLACTHANPQLQPTATLRESSSYNAPARNRLCHTGGHQEQKHLEMKILSVPCVNLSTFNVNKRPTHASGTLGQTTYPIYTCQRYPVLRKPQITQNVVESRTTTKIQPCRDENGDDSVQRKEAAERDSLWL